MKKLFMIMLMLVCLTGCTYMNWFLGIDDKGDKVDNTPPYTYLVNVLKAFGPLGVAAGGAITVGGAAYIGNKRSKDPFAAVVGAIQKIKDDMSPEDKEAFVKKLKGRIPNKYHAAIGKIKDAL